LPYDANVPLDQLIAIHKEGRLDFREATPAEREVLKRATALDPRRRYASCSEFAEALENCFRPATAVRRSAAPVWAAALVGLLLLAAGFWYVDPAHWFRAPASETTNTVQMYTLSVPGEAVQGELAIVRAGSESPEPPIALAAQNRIELGPEDSVTVRARSDSPFLKPLDARYSLADLERMDWQIQLPAVPREEIVAAVEQYLESGDQQAAAELFRTAARFGESWNQFDSPRSLEVGQVVQFRTDPWQPCIALAQRDASGDHPLHVHWKGGQLASALLPPCADEQSLIESLVCLGDPPGLVVMRQRSIWLWSGTGETVRALFQPPEAAGAWRFVIARASSDGRWFAAADSLGVLRLWDLSHPESQTPVGEATLSRGLIDLYFDASGKRLVVVTDSVPLLDVDLAAIPSGGTRPAELQLSDASVQPALDGPVIIESARCGKNALAVASETTVCVGPDFFTSSPQPFGSLKTIPGGALFMLLGAEGADRLLSIGDGDPPGAVWNTATVEPLMAIDSTRLASSVRATRHSVRMGEPARLRPTVACCLRSNCRNLRHRVRSGTRWRGWAMLPVCTSDFLTIPTICSRLPKQATTAARAGCCSGICGAAGSSGIMRMRRQLVLYPHPVARHSPEARHQPEARASESVPSDTLSLQCTCLRCGLTSIARAPAADPSTLHFDLHPSSRRIRPRRAAGSRQAGRVSASGPLFRPITQIV
jgi:hypothetical protein